MREPADRSLVLVHQVHYLRDMYFDTARSWLPSMLVLYSINPADSLIETTCSSQLQLTCRWCARSVINEEHLRAITGVGCQYSSGPASHMS